MSDKKAGFESEEQISPREAADFLHQLANAVGSGKKIRLSKGDKQVVFALPDILSLEIELVEERKKGRIKRELEIELEWYEPQGYEEEE